MNDIITRTDSYKVSHWLQYPPGTKHVQSYIEARWSEEFPAIKDTLFFGLQAFLKKIAGVQVTTDKIDRMEALMKVHGEPFHREGWEYIRDKHNGHLPVVIKAAPEGIRVPLSNVLVTVQNTDPACYWLTSYLETSLLRAVWYPTSVASISRHCKDIIGYWLDQTGDCAGLPFKLHDFGGRGVSSGESAEIGGAAHLVNFMGTDTIEALLWLQENYGADCAGFSIPAAEHSTITTWGGPKNEVESFRNMLKQFGSGPLVAVVSDSYDIYEACKTWGTTLKQDILDMNATLVVRPDSGDPIEVTLEVVKLLDKYFGSEVNEKGYKVLHPKVRIIQGDGVNPSSIKKILTNYATNGYSADNIAFGMGGALLQKVNRDTFGWAMKASAIHLAEEVEADDGLIEGLSFWLPVYKQPKTMTSKNSKRGRLQLFYNEEEQRFTTLNTDEMAHHLPAPWAPVLREVFRDGILTVNDTLDNIRTRSEGPKK